MSEVAHLTSLVTWVIGLQIYKEYKKKKKIARHIKFLVGIMQQVFLIHLANMCFEHVNLIKCIYKLLKFKLAE